MYAEDDLLPISGLQHLLFCERQWALIHVEQQWEENRLTAEGRLLHDRVHEGGTEARPGVVVARGLRLRSFRLGLSGQADVVEFQQVPAETKASVRLSGRSGWWRAYPVEYKRGRPKMEPWDEVQLCAQAMCLEEMLGAAIEAGALFYGRNRRRAGVVFDLGLRRQVENLAGRMHALYGQGITPPAVYSKKCANCSLLERCLPELTTKRTSVARYLAGALPGEGAQR